MLSSNPFHFPADPSALEQAALVRQGARSSQELVAMYLGRIRRHNPKLTAFVSVFDDRAMATARRLDRLRGRRGPRGLPPFHGVPIGVKDLNLARGAFARMGSRSFRWLWSPVDDLTVRALRRAGFVLLGKLATSELALMPVTEPDIHDPTRNPWSLEHSAGGSSGGSGSAVAAGLLPIAQGSDGGGSIRIPAAFCHLFGFKVSRGAIPNPHLDFDHFHSSVIGPLARTVEDGAALLDVLAGRDPEAPGSFLVAARRTPPRLRLRVVTRSPIGSTDPELADAARRVAAQAARLGHIVDDEGGPPKITLDDFLPIYQRMAADGPVPFERLLQPVTRWLRAEGRRHPRADVFRLYHRVAADVLAWFGSSDVVITPTTPHPAPRVGAWRDLEPAEMFRAAAPLGAFTAGFNVSGQPAASLPVGFTRAGLPIGVQLVGRPGADETLLALSRELMTSLAADARSAMMEKA